MKKRSRLRLVIQCAAACLSNGYLKGFLRGRIYTGSGKKLCAPGLNCYSCPGALGACPMGALQNAFAEKDLGAILYVFGMLTLFGTLLGRAVCGFLCPFGLFQDLLHRIPFFRKLSALPGEKFLRKAKYLILILLVILLPLFVRDEYGVSSPWFCKYLCPAGTLEGGIPLVIMNQALQSVIGFLYGWKLGILILLILLSLLLYRPFCRYLCPLGAIYGLCNRFALFRYSVSDACTQCGKCQKVCKLSIKTWENPNSAECIRCGECISACPQEAITDSFSDLLEKAKNRKK